MAWPADHEGLPTLVHHDIHPFGPAGLSDLGEVGKLTDLMNFDISVPLADLAHAPEKSLNDLPVAVWSRIRRPIDGDRIPVPLEGYPTEPSDQWFSAWPRDLRFEAGS